MFGPRIKHVRELSRVAVDQGSLHKGIQQRDAGPEWIWRTQEQIQICPSPVVPQVDGEPKHRRQHSGACSRIEPFWGDPSGVRATVGHFDSPGLSAPSQPSLTSDPSVPFTSAGASWPPALHESAGEDIALPLPHPSDAATSSTPVASWRQRQRGQVQSYAPEFLHLNASLQNCLKLLSEQVAAGFNLINKSILELRILLQRMHSDASQSPNHTLF
ncbi:uncharacterized protein [Ranitomeya imitator]|uniref:uncharacterized protein n=1 Tax=Ranitomeya imitator TaxID=111125 RepID=UPI0037E8D007